MGFPRGKSVVLCRTSGKAAGVTYRLLLPLLLPLVPHHHLWWDLAPRASPQHRLCEPQQRSGAGSAAQSCPAG